MRCRDDLQFHFVRPVGVVAIRDIFNGEKLLALDTLRNTAVVLQPRPGNDKATRVQVRGDVSAGVSSKGMKFSHHSDNNAECLAVTEDLTLQPSERYVNKLMIAIINCLLKVRQPNHSTPCQSHLRLPTFQPQQHPNFLLMQLTARTLQVSDVKVSLYGCL